MLAPSAGEIEGVLLHCANQKGEIPWIVLPIAVHGKDEIALGCLQAGQQGRRLAEAMGVGQHLALRVALDDGIQFIRSGVGAAIVHEDDMPRTG